MYFDIFAEIDKLFRCYECLKMQLNFMGYQIFFA